ncbi:MAG: DinB family protein [bacterium]
MATAAEARSAISAAFDTYIAELGQAQPVWDTKPATSAEGEDAWCARQVAEHIAGSGAFFGQGIARAAGLEGPTPARLELADAASAVSETTRTHGLLMGVVDQLNDDHLAVEFDHPQLGKQTIGGMLGIVSYHLNDHAKQLSTLRTS